MLTPPAPLENRPIDRHSSMDRLRRALNRVLHRRRARGKLWMRLNIFRQESRNGRASAAWTDPLVEGFYPPFADDHDRFIDRPHTRSCCRVDASPPHGQGGPCESAA